MDYSHTYWMEKALALAMEANQKEEVPVGACVVLNDSIIGRGYNQVECLHDGTAHAEMIAITAASNFLESRYLQDVTLYVTKEPCLMCAGAILHARIKTLVFAAYDVQEGAAGSKYDVMRENSRHFVEIIPGIGCNPAEALLKEFFQTLRRKEK